MEVAKFNIILSLLLIYIIILISSSEVEVEEKADPQEYGSSLLLNNQTNETNSTDNESEKDLSTHFGTLHTLKNLTRWAAHEEKLVANLTKRLELIRKEEKLIEEYLSDYAESSGEALLHVYESKVTPEERGEVIASSYVLGHRMIVRYTSIIDKLKEFLRSGVYRENTANIADVLGLWEDAIEVIITNDTASRNDTDATKNGTVVWPNWKDKYMSMTAFFHLQEVNGFLAEELLHGLRFDTDYGGALNAKNCFELGTFALQRGYYYMAIQWLELAKNLALSTGDDSISIDFVSSILKSAIDQNNLIIDHLKNSKNISEEEYFRKYSNIYLHPVTEGEPEENRISGHALAYLDGKTNSETVVQSAYNDLCMGKTLQSPKIQAKLKCHYEQKRHPYLYINPIKTEQLSESPLVYQFYEMIGAKEAERIKRLGAPWMSLSELVGLPTGFDAVSEYRTSVGSGMLPEEVSKTTKMGEILTGLDVFGTSEVTQLVEYTYGRFYTFHTDAYEEDIREEHHPEQGDRMATILYYLDIPKLGGLTPFCQAGVSAHQIPGSAILWYNIFKNGTVRRDVDHGACPILHGSKLIMNQWIRYAGNFLRYKCSLNQFE